MKLVSIQRNTRAAELRVQFGPFWLHVDRGDEAIVGDDLGPFHGQSSVDLGAGRPDDDEAAR